MEAGGDSLFVSTLPHDEDSIEFERNLDVMKKTLNDEETRLVELEKTRLNLQKEIEELYNEVVEEKKKYRKAIDGIIQERENLSRSLIESCTSMDLTPIQSTLSFFESSGYANDIKIESEIEQIRCDLIDSYVTTKEDYLHTIKDHFQQLKKKHEK